MDKKAEANRFWIKVTPAYRATIVRGWILTSLPALLLIVCILAGLGLLLFLSQARSGTGVATNWIGAATAMWAVFHLSRYLVKSFRWHLGKLYMTPTEHVVLLERHQKWCDEVDKANRDGRPEPHYPW